MTDIIASPTTALYIGGQERPGTDRLAIAGPARPGVVVGYAAAASAQDAADAVAAAKAAFSPVQNAFVTELVEEAKESGARVLEFGELPGGEFEGGNFVRPAIVVDADPNQRLVTHEQFGPVIPILPFDTEEEAIRMANDTRSGLCGSVWTADADRANRVCGQLAQMAH